MSYNLVMYKDGTIKETKIDLFNRLRADEERFNELILHRQYSAYIVTAWVESTDKIDIRNFQSAFSAFIPEGRNNDYKDWEIHFWHVKFKELTNWVEKADQNQKNKFFDSLKKKNRDDVVNLLVEI